MPGRPVRRRRLMEARAKAEAARLRAERTAEPESHAESDEVTRSRTQTSDRTPEPDEVQDVEPMSGTDRHDQDTEKRCSRCNRVLSVTEFHRTVRHGVSTYRSACKKCRGEPMPQFIPDRSREAVEGRDDPVPEPMPASSPAMPRYLREALKAESEPALTREQVIRRLPEMDPDERLDEL